MLGKKCLKFITVFLIAVSMVACGQANGNSNDDGSAPVASQTEHNTQENTSEPAQAEPSETVERVESVSQEQTIQSGLRPTARFRRCLPVAPLRQKISTMPSSKAGGMIWMPVKDTFIMPCRTFLVGRHKGGEINEE